MGELRNQRQEAFCQGIVRGLSQERAYVEAGFSPRSADANASRLRGNAKVASRISKLQREIASALTEEVKLDVEAIVRRYSYNLAALADPSELMEFRRDACRYCHGLDHSYQWRTKGGSAAPRPRGSPCLKAKQAIMLEPDPSGGFGYSQKLEPHPDCPE